jgi:hypothetical protein
MAITPVAANGQPVPSQIATPDTVDLHSVNLTAGETYVFLARGASEGGGSLTNPNMEIGGINASGNLVPFVGDKGSPLSIDPVIVYAPPTTGTYVVAVGSDIPHGIGTYTLQIAPAGPEITLPPISIHI